MTTNWMTLHLRCAFHMNHKLSTCAIRACGQSGFYSLTFLVGLCKRGGSTSMIISWHVTDITTGNPKFHIFFQIEKYSTVHIIMNQWVIKENSINRKTNFIYAKCCVCYNLRVSRKIKVNIIQREKNKRNSQRHQVYIHILGKWKKPTTTTS